MTDAYARFLDSADLTTWTACLDELASSGHESPEGLAEALCVAGYVQWLGRVSGEQAAADHAAGAFDALRETLERRSAGGVDAYRTAWGFVLAWMAYTDHAREWLERDGDIAPEHLLIVLQDDTVGAVAQLRPLVTGPQRTRFLPVVMHYGFALVNAGQVHAAREAVRASGFDEAHPMLVDVLASACERLGEWPDAYALYRSSSWPDHRYRAAMIRAIAHADGRQAHDEFELDDAAVRYLAQAEGGELDQAALTRRTAFLNACLWQPVEDWVVAFELGKVAFRRRRHAEADTHFSRALAEAPEAAGFAISQMRFTNLTWLTGGEAYVGLRMDPEAVREGYAALALSDEGDDTYDIRTWLAREAGDQALLAGFEAWPPYQRGDAHAILGEEEDAICSWLESYGTEYRHRSAEGLIQCLAPAGFRHSVRHLADVVLRESADDFLALWETVDDLLLDAEARADADAPDGDASEQIDAYCRRLLELCRFDFKNTVRAHGRMVRAGYEELAEELLLRAPKQADGVADLIAAAMLYRLGQGPWSSRDEEEGLRCLARALAEARDRLERLEIARELQLAGSQRSSRRVLEADGALSPDAVLDHHEVRALLQTGDRLRREEELVGIVKRAIRRLAADHASGALGPDPGRFVDRLAATVERYDGALASYVYGELWDLHTVSTATQCPGREDDGWQQLRSDIRDAEREDPEAFAALLDECLAPLDVTASLGQRVVAVDALRALLETIEERAAGVEPSLPEDITPVGRGNDRGAALRTVRLCDLWRARLTAAGPEQRGEADEELRAFLAEERTLLEGWERARVQARSPELRGMACVCEALLRVLDPPLDPAQREHPNPMLRNLFAAVETDLESLRTETAALLESLREELEMVATA